MADRCESSVRGTALVTLADVISPKLLNGSARSLPHRGSGTRGPPAADMTFCPSVSDGPDVAPLT
jgi:hypothetical protein